MLLPHSHPPPKEHSPLAKRLLQLDSDLIYRDPPPHDHPFFRVEKGSIPILLSAPHATEHTRNGSSKMEEEFTAAFVRWLSAETGAHAIYTTHQSPEDPNWDQQSRYKEAIAQLTTEHNIQLVLDLHGMTSRHKIGVALGTMNGQSYEGSLEMVQQPFLDHGFSEVALSQLSTLSDLSWRRLVINHPKFTGGLKSFTVTRFSAEILNIPAIQIEIASAARIVHRGPNEGWPFTYYGSPQGIEATLSALKILIQNHL